MNHHIMTEQQRARGCLLGLACGDAMGRPIEFRNAEEIDAQHGTVTEMLGHGTHGQPAGTITDDTEMALCIADSLVDRCGFDPPDIADRFVAWLASGPFDIGLMTQDALTQLQQGTPWHEAGVDVWNSRPEGSNAGNGSVMRCAPHAIAFRHFDAELTYVSRQSSAITHADPRCQWGCVVLNRTLAALIRGESEPLGTALTSAAAPDELRTALQQVQAVVAGERDRSAVEAQLSTSGYVVDSLQAGLYFGLTADSIEDAIIQAVNSGGDTDTVGAITGTVAGARFGATDVPDRWTDEIEESDRLERLARTLLTIRQKIADTEFGSVDDGSLLFKQRTVDGPAYVSVRDYQPTLYGHRPYPPPHWTIGIDYHELTPQTAAMCDWERRAYAVQTDRCRTYTAPQVALTDETDGEIDAQSALIPVPQYPFADGFDDLPEIDQRRITRDGRAAAEAFVRAYAAFASVRSPIVQSETEEIGINRMDPIAGATRFLIHPFGDVGEALLGNTVSGGYDSPAEIEAAFDIAVIEEVLADQPQVISEAMEPLMRLLSGAGAVLDYVTQLRCSQQYHLPDSPSVDEQHEDLRDQARTMVGELHVVYESLRRVAVRHPEIDDDRWREITAVPGGR